MNKQFEQGGVKASRYGPLCGQRTIEEFQDVEVDLTAAVG
jgi:hypothetical protein